MDNNLFMGVLVVSLGGILSLLLTFFKLKKMFSEELEAKMSVAIEIARNDAKSRADLLQLEIKQAELKIVELRQTVDKDIGFMKDKYLLEFKNLDTRFDDLKTEIRQQYSQVMSLLEKMIQKN
jgi:hypothetical protein